ncbi:hypothetical protein BASA81_007947 [Batrachochytrium salamandrivorans]|nr:hypothetical protein BASA81_007947 [Batrachochytrium salamandrivorans]
MSYRCNNCEEDAVQVELVLGQNRCSVCGEVVDRILSAPVPLPTQQHAEVADFFTRPIQTPTSQKALLALKRITPDKRSNSLDPQVTIRVSGLDLHLMGIPAKFGPIASLVDRPVRFLNATLGEPNLVLKRDGNGSIAVVYRGDISFVQKAELCAQAGFAGVVIIQTHPTWPFSLTDTTNQSNVTIPVVAISQSSGKQLVDHLNHLATVNGGAMAADARVRMTITLLESDGDFICAICHDDLVHTNQVICQLPCLHYFHDDCVLPWLRDKSSCPNCRFQLPSDVSDFAPAQANRPERGVELGWFG